MRAGITHRQGKFKLSIFTGLTSYKNRAVVKLYYGADYGETKSNACFILTPGFIGFVKSVKDLVYLVLFQTLAAVSYNCIDKFIVLAEIVGDISALVNKLYSVFRQVVYYLLSKILVGIDEKSACVKSSYINVLCLDALFKKQHRPDSQTSKVKHLCLKLQLACFIF